MSFRCNRPTCRLAARHHRRRTATRAAHRGMNISEQEYLAVADDIMAALDKNGVGDQEKREILMIAFSLKGEILRQ